MSTATAEQSAKGVALTVAPPPTISLTSALKNMLEIEQEFAAILSVQDEILPEDLEEYQKIHAESLLARNGKRDSTGYFLEHCDTMVAAAKARIEREKATITFYETAKARVAKWTETVIRSLGRDNKGKFKSLEGQVFRLALAKNPDSVLITDEEQIPSQWKRATIKFSSAEMWERLVQCAVENPEYGITAEQIVNECKVTYEVRSDDVKEALNNNITIPGADLNINQYRLKKDTVSKAMKQAKGNAWQHQDQ